MMILALAVAASASGPRKRPTHMALIDPLSDWRMFYANVGIANSISVDAIGPCVRSFAPVLPAAMLIPQSHQRLGEDSRPPVRPEPVEGSFFFKERGFDKLSPNGFQ